MDSAELHTETDNNIARTFFLVEATQFERQMLWEHWNEKVRWQQIYLGYSAQVGELGEHWVCVCVVFAEIEGRVVAFYEGVSSVVDHTQIEVWVRKTFSTPTWGGGRWAQCDAGNFHLCVQAIREANAAAASKKTKKTPKRAVPKKRARARGRRS